MDMICDRTCNSFIYLSLAVAQKESKVRQYLMIICFFLDFGSHWLQFVSSALMKSTSHKGKNEEEDPLVKFFYDNNGFFQVVCVLAEFCPGFLIVYIKSVGKAAAVEHVAFYGFFSLVIAVLSLKMIINFK